MLTQYKDLPAKSRNGLGMRFLRESVRSRGNEKAQCAAEKQPSAGARDQSQPGHGCPPDQRSRICCPHSALLNKDTAFTAEERKEPGLTGLLPPDISTLDLQVRRAYIQYEKLTDALGRNVYLTALHDRNEVLFYRLLSNIFAKWSRSSTIGLWAWRWSSTGMNAAVRAASTFPSTIARESKRLSRTWALMTSI